MPIAAAPRSAATSQTSGREPVAAAGLPARILVALDASDHANRALAESVRLAAAVDGTITGIHVYAARLHDARFRQMEGGLPERYRKESEMERQRAVHDDLITRGLELISDGYHKQAAKACAGAGVPFRRLSPEGKNYRRIVEAVAGGGFDLLALGSLGLGGTVGSRVGTVCRRVARRSPIDVLVIRDPGTAVGDGPLVAGLDGSPRSFGTLMTALALGRRFGAAVHAVAAYDPYFHYVAFHRISGSLSEEAARRFRFKDQERLHEEIIDSGVARIYRSHLEVGRSLAAEAGIEIACELLDGKPSDAIAAYAARVNASLLLVGMTGIHADAELDIGGNAENLLHMAPCHLWLGRRTHVPPLETVARETIAWTDEAEARMGRVPEAARAMVRGAILRFAQESGHTVVTSALIDEATRRFCPGRSKGGDAAPGMKWSDEASTLLAEAGDPSAAAGVRLRAEKRARREGAAVVAAAHVHPFITGGKATAPAWTAAALARIAQVPKVVRGAVRRRVVAAAAETGIGEVGVGLVETTIRDSLVVMEDAMRKGGHGAGGDDR